MKKQIKIKTNNNEKRFRVSYFFAFLTLNNMFFYVAIKTLLDCLFVFPLEFNDTHISLLHTYILYRTDFSRFSSLKNK